RVQTRAANDTVARPARPAHHVDTRQRTLGRGVPDPGRRILARRRAVQTRLGGEARRGIDAITHREDHGVAGDHAELAGPRGTHAVALALETRLLDLEPHHLAALGEHAAGRGEEAEGQARPGAGFRLGTLPEGV